MKNGKGVVMRLETKQQGLRLTLAAGGSPLSSPSDQALIAAENRKAA